jgi:hypothetical protein
MAVIVPDHRFGERAGSLEGPVEISWADLCSSTAAQARLLVHYVAIAASPQPGLAPTELDQHRRTGMTRDEEIEQRARAIVIARTVYEAVLVVWLIAIAAMLLIWWLTTPNGYFWPVWPILGLAVAAVVWGLALYRKFPFRIQEDKVAREVKRLRDAG